VLGNSKIQDIASPEALANLLTIEFWRYAIFYIAVVMTGTFITFIVYGVR
jgi:hypothetical protein